MANDSGQFKRASYMALGGVALILGIALSDADVLQTSAGMSSSPEAGLGRRFLPAPDSLRADTVRLNAFRPDAFRPDAFHRDAFQPDGFHRDAFQRDSPLRNALRPDSLAPGASTKASGARPRIALRDTNTIARTATSRRVAAAVEELRERQLLLPLAGLTLDRVRDSFNQGRSGGTRRHNAIDLFAPRGTPILAVDSGTVLKLNRSTLGGIQLYAADASLRFVFYYAHLDAYHPAIEEGMTVARGDTLGFVGTTGNAPASSPHLHFAIYRTDNVHNWFTGTPINPRDVFRPR